LGADYCDDFREVLAREDVQIISMMVEPARSPEIAEACTAAGKHLVSDKPIAADLAGARRIVTAAEQAGIESLVTFGVRYSPGLVQAREIVRRGEIGDLLVANFQYLMAAGPLAGFRATPEYRERVGGGEVLNFGCYAVDYLRWLTGAEVKSVRAEVGTFFYEDYRESGLEDLGQLSLEFENGVVGAILTGRTTTPQGGTVTILDLTGTRGALRLDDLDDVVESSAATVERVPTGPNPGQAMIFEFVDNLLAGRPSPITARDGLANLAVIEAAYRSARTGHAEAPEV
jgi:predicted dehydrogenase